MDKNVIEEGLLSGTMEVYKVSKKIYSPFEAYLSAIQHLSKADKGYDVAIRKPMEKFTAIVNSSKLSTNMKLKFIRNMHVDAYRTLTAGNGMSPNNIQAVMHWSDKTFYEVRQEIGTK